MTLLEADCTKLVDEELESTIDRIVHDNSLLRSELPCYARIQNIPSDYSPWDILDKYDYEIVRITSIIRSGGKDNASFFIEYESNISIEAGEALIEAGDIRQLKNEVSLQSKVTKKMMYGFTDLLQLLEETSCNPKALLGFIIKPDGIWLDILSEDDSEGLHPVELAAYYVPFTNHDVSKPVLSLPCTGKELKQFLEITGHYSGEDIFVQEESGPTIMKYKIAEEERKAKGKSAVQLAVESYLDDVSEGNKTGFYSFLKKQIKLPKEAILKDGNSYAYFFKEVKEKGSLEGVFLNHPKEGKKEGDPRWNHYSGNEVSGIISKEKNKRRVLQAEK